MFYLAGFLLVAIPLVQEGKICLASADSKSIVLLDLLSRLPELGMWN